MTDRRQAVGRRGERLAESYLVELGAELLERNYRKDYAEVDLVFEHDGELVAVEVKTRDVEDPEQPEEAVRVGQLRRISNGLAAYAQEHDLLEMPLRIDVVMIVVHSGGDVLRLDHLRSVYPW